MGKLINAIDPKKSDIIGHLTYLGFTYESFVCGTNNGYQKCIPTNDGYYYVWVHCDFDNRVLSIYKEYDCGGEVSSATRNIPKELIRNDDAEAFMEWLVNQCEYYL